MAIRIISRVSSTTTATFLQRRLTSRTRRRTHEQGKWRFYSFRVINATRKRVGVGSSSILFLLFFLFLPRSSKYGSVDRYYESFVTLSGCGVAKRKKKNCAVNGAPSVEERA